VINKFRMDCLQQVANRELSVQRDIRRRRGEITCKIKMCHFMRNNFNSSQQRIWQKQQKERKQP
jgi:hypothetical protein